MKSKYAVTVHDMLGLVKELEIQAESLVVQDNIVTMTNNEVPYVVFLAPLKEIVSIRLKQG